MVAQEDSLLSRRQRRVLQVALALLVLSTFSRGAIGFAAALAIRHAWAHRTVWARRLAVGCVVACVGLIAALTVGRLHVDPTRPSTASYEVPDPGNRREAFVTSLDTLSDHPLVGKGPGSFPGENRGQPFRAHLTPLNVAATLGLPALAALTFLFVSLWRNRRRPTRLATWSGFAGLAIDALAQDVEHFRHVWILVGVADAQRQRTGAGDAILGGRWRAG
jgi:small-conductance mechanosensitive channel